ncbi:MAG: hypothetical protein LBB21_02460 [Holosporaceae bacterium]|jgi:uncharacterized protein YbaR (Trm112 family)|nr:hypothetical protein [Holosporaceae bacterium]
MKETPLIDENLLKILICPKSGVKLHLKDNRLVCEDLCISYPIENGIPLIYDGQSVD